MEEVGDLVDLMGGLREGEGVHDLFLMGDAKKGEGEVNLKEGVEEILTVNFGKHGLEAYLH